MSLKDFIKEFEQSRLEEWKNKYIKLKEMIHLIKLIRNDIKKNGGEIIETINIRDSTSSEPASEDKLERRSFNLDILNDKEGIFDKNEKIFNSPIMFEIDNAFKELKALQFEDDIKIFLYFLHIEVHNVYVFYLSIEKEIYTRTNSYLFQRHNSNDKNNNNEEYVSNQLKELIEIAYLTYSFYLYIDLNVESVKQILEYFDSIFLKINDGISIKKLFYNKNILNKESDLKYILGFKIINECSILLENYCFEIKNNFQKNKKIKEQCKELQEVLSFIIEKNTIRVDDNIYEVYQRTGIQNNILKKKENLNLDIQNSLLVERTQSDILEEEFEYDRQIKIKITKKNIINLILIYFHIFFYSFFGIIPYIVFFILCKKNYNDNENKKEKIKYYEIGIALSTTHLGSLLSKYIISSFEKYKFPLIFFGICFSISFSLTLMSLVFVFEDFRNDEIFVNEYILFFIFNVLSRFIFGLSGGRIIVRKYINLFLPESKIKCFSKLYMTLVYLGNVLGILFLFIINFLNVNILFFNLKLNIVSLPFIVGFFISLLYLIFIIIFFSEPDGDKAKMLSYKIRINENEIKKDEINEEKKDDLELITNEYNSTINDNNSLEENNEEIPLEKKNPIMGGQKIIYLDDEKDKDNKSLSAKTESKMARKRRKNKLRLSNLDLKRSVTGDNKGNSSLLNYISTSSENESFRRKSFIKATEQMKEKLISAEEIKGLNSIEKAIIEINNKNNFDDTNLFPKELSRIKQNQYKNNKTFFKTIIVFILLLNVSNVVNEFILLFIQINAKNKDNNIYDKEYNNGYIKKILTFVLIMQLMAFFISIVFTKSSIQKINRKLLLILNLFLILSISAIIFCLVKNVKYLDKFYLLIIVFVFAINNLIIGLTSLFNDKIVPSFIKFCHFNVKYLISYISTLGKLLGGISFSIMMYLIETKIYEPKKNLIIFVFGFDCLTLISFIVLCCNYNSMKMRALSKLKAIQI